MCRWLLFSVVVPVGVVPWPPPRMVVGGGWVGPTGALVVRPETTVLELEVVDAVREGACGSLSKVGNMDGLTCCKAAGKQGK